MPDVSPAPGEGDWPWRTEPPVLPPGEIHVFRAIEPFDSLRIEQLSEFLADDERTRAASYRFEADRQRFIYCRGTLRELLSRYLNASPSALNFQSNRFGKPALRKDSAGAIQFNLSHTRGMSLFAFAADQPVGVDVEAVREGMDMEQIARGFFHPSEWSDIATSPLSARARSFFTLWTCKEALLKCRGDGLSGDLSAFEIIPPAAKEGDAVIHAPGDPSASFWVRVLEPGPGFTAAMAAPRRALLRTLQLS